MNPVNPVRILPDLQCALVCEDIRREFNGKFILIGILDTLVVPQLPFRIGRLYLFKKWISGIGDFREEVHFLAPDEATVLVKTEVRFSMNTPFENAATVSVFGNLELKSPGFHYIEILIDEVRKLRIPIEVVIAPKPEQQPEPQKPS